MASTPASVLENTFGQSLDHENSITESVLEWLAPRISFSISFSQLDPEARPKNESNTSSSDFEFSVSSLSGKAYPEQFMVTADEIFRDGRLIPLPVFSQDLTPSTEDQEARHLRLSSEEVLSDQPFAFSSRLSSPDCPSSFFSRLSSLKTWRSSSSWNIIRNLFQPRRAVNMETKTSSKEPEKLLKTPGKGSFPFESDPNMPNFGNVGSLKTAALLDRARAKPSQAIAALLWIPSHALICFSFPSQNLDRIATEDRTVDQYEHPLSTDFKSDKTVHKSVDFSDSFRRLFSSGKSASLPCSRVSSLEREIGTNGSQNTPQTNTMIHHLTSSDTNQMVDTKMRRSNTVPRRQEMLQNQNKACNGRDKTILHQKKKASYDLRAYSDRVLPQGVRVAPLLNVPACLSPGLRKSTSRGDLSAFGYVLSFKKGGSKIKIPPPTEHVACH